MAARTTSRAEADQLRGWLHDRGYVDGVARGAVACVPFLGALIFERGAEVCGVDHAGADVDPDPTCSGAIRLLQRADSCPIDAERVWISPGYEVHPVATIGATTYALDAPPSFTRIT